MTRSHTTTNHTLKLSNGEAFGVRVVSPLNYNETVVLVGGLTEHYRFMYKTISQVLADNGFRAIGVGVPYEAHLEPEADVSDFLWDVVKSTALFSSDQPHLILHSGAGLVVNAQSFDNGLFSRIVLWSSIGLHHKERHPTSAWYAAKKFLFHSSSAISRNSFDLRIYVTFAAAIVAFARNLLHIPSVFRLFYQSNIRDSVAGHKGIGIIHGQHDSLFPIDSSDIAWLQKHSPLVEHRSEPHWTHTHIYSREAAHQMRDILKMLALNWGDDTLNDKQNKEAS